MSNIEIFCRETGWRDISPAWFLMFMSLTEQPVPMSQLVKFAVGGGSQAAISRGVTALCGESRIRKDGGYPVASRYEDPADRRCKLVKLNAEGLRIKSLMHSERKSA